MEHKLYKFQNVHFLHVFLHVFISDSLCFYKIWPKQEVVTVLFFRFGLNRENYKASSDDNFKFFICVIFFLIHDSLRKIFAMMTSQHCPLVIQPLSSHISRWWVPISLYDILAIELPVLQRMHLLWYDVLNLGIDNCMVVIL